MKLLVVDECAEFCELVREYSDLCRHQYGLVCQTADPGEAALKKIANWLPEIVLVDAHALGGAREDLERLRGEANARIVITSESMSPEIEAAAERWGASGYLAKSRDPDEMELFLKRLTQIGTDNEESQ